MALHCATTVLNQYSGTGMKIFWCNAHA